MRAVALGLREDIDAGHIREGEAKQASETLRAEAEVSMHGHVIDDGIECPAWGSHAIRSKAV